MAALDDLFGSCALAAPPRPWPRISSRSCAVAESCRRIGGRTLDSGRTLGPVPGRAHGYLGASNPQDCDPQPCLHRWMPRQRPAPSSCDPPRAGDNDLVGLSAEGCPDLRPWLDHGRWSIRHPFSSRSGAGWRERAIRVSAVGANPHQIPVGPVSLGSSSSAISASRPAAKRSPRLEERLGYVHKGIEANGRARTDTRRTPRRTGLGRQHCRLRVGFCTCSRGRHWRRGHATRAGAGAIRPNWNALPIISATSASATTPPSR